MPGDPVVMIPPMLCDARVFQDQIAAISRSTAVLVVPTGMGDTLEEIAVQILDWAPRSFSLVGAAMGGMIALEIIRRAPDRVARIALINTTAQADTPQQASNRETEIIAAKSGRFADVIAHEIDPERFHEHADRATLTTLMRNMANAIGAETYVSQARALQKRKDQQAILRQIKRPALVISGDSDPATPLRRQEFIAEMIPYAKHDVIPDAGFMPTLEQPHHVSTALRDWLRQPLVLR